MTIALRNLPHFSIGCICFDSSIGTDAFIMDAKGLALAKVTGSTWFIYITDAPNLHSFRS